MAWARALARAGLLTESRARRHRQGARGGARRAGGGHLPLPSRARRHPHEHRAPPAGAGRGRRAAGCTRAARATTRSRSTSVCTSRRSSCAHARRRCATCRQALLARATEPWTRRMPGYTHLQRAQPIVLGHHLLAYVFMLQRDRERFADCAPRADALPLGAARPRRHRRSRSTARRSRGTSASPPYRQQPRRGERSRLRPRVPGRGRHHRHAPVAARRRPDPLGDGGVRLRGVLRRLRHRLVDHAAEEEPRRGRADPRQERPALRQPRGGAHDDEGAAARLQLRHAGGQGAVLRLRRHAGGDPRRAAADARLAHLPHGSHAARRPARTSRRRPTSPTISCARGCRFARPTRWSARSCATPSSAGATLDAAQLDELRRFSPLFDADASHALTVEASLRARAVTGGTAPAAVRRALAHARDAHRAHEPSPPPRARRHRRAHRGGAPRAAARGHRSRPSGGCRRR